jgi:hypothetical protein
MRASRPTDNFTTLSLRANGQEIPAAPAGLTDLPFVLQSRQILVQKNHTAGFLKRLTAFPRRNHSFVAHFPTANQKPGTLPRAFVWIGRHWSCSDGRSRPLSAPAQETEQSAAREGRKRYRQRGLGSRLEQSRRAAWGSARRLRTEVRTAGDCRPTGRYPFTPTPQEDLRVKLKDQP